jgi:hypothetical protein
MTCQKYETRDMHDPPRVEDFINAFDDLCRMEKENGTFEDHFHSERRRFAAADIRNHRIRDASERYVLTRIEILTKIKAQKEAAELGRAALGAKNMASPIPTDQESAKYARNEQESK